MKEPITVQYLLNKLYANWEIRELKATFDLEDGSSLEVHFYGEDPVSEYEVLTEAPFVVSFVVTEAVVYSEASKSVVQVHVVS